MPPNRVPELFDRVRLRHRRNRRAGRFAQYDFLKARVSRDLVERLADTPRIFPVALDLGTHRGTLSARLVDRKGGVLTLASDLSAGMASAAQAQGAVALVADEEVLPLAPQSVDLVASALSLHWVNDLPGALIQIRTVLKPDGLFLGALLGAGTLHELRTSLAEAEAELRGGGSPRVSPLPRLQDVAGLLQRAGFALPVVDKETVTVRYATPLGLLADLGGMAERASFTRGLSTPLSRRILARMSEIYASRFTDPDGRVRASFEVIYMSGWAPGPNQPQPKRRGSATVSLAEVFKVSPSKPPAGST